MQFSSMLAPSIGSRKVRAKNTSQTSLVSTEASGMLLELSSDDDEDSINEKINEKRQIFNIHDDIELSSEDEAKPNASQAHSMTSQALKSSTKIPSFPLKSSSYSAPTVNVSIASNVDGQDLKKIMASILHDNKAKDLEIRSLRKEIAELEDTINNFDQEAGGDNEDLRHARIKELSKKAKRLTVSYEKERSVNSQLQARISELEGKLGNGEKNQVTPSQSEQIIQKLKTEMKITKDKLASCIRKVEDERAQNMTLKTEIRNLQKVLAQEVGESFNLEKLLKGESNAKGRTEQISILKDRVKELNRKLQFATTVRSSPDSAPSNDSNDHNGLYKMELSRRKQQEITTVEFDKMKLALEESRKKNEGFTARIKILEKTGREAKSKIGLLLEKSKTDDQFIQALKDELGKIKSGKLKDAETEKTRETINSLQVKTVKLEAHVADLESKLQASSKLTMPDSNLDGGSSHNKLINLVESLKQEITTLRGTKVKLEQSLAEEKKNATYLKQQVQRERERLNNSISAESQQGKARKDIIEDLKESLAILSDENQALKVTMRMISESKSTDLEMYQQLLDQARSRLEEQ